LKNFKLYLRSDLILFFFFCRGSSENELENRERSEAVEERDVVQEEKEHPQPQEVRYELEHPTPEIKQQTKTTLVYRKIK
jgi:hypothetical protein